MKYLPPFKTLSDPELQQLLKDHHIGLTVAEARKIERKLKRTPTLTEAILWGIQGSEHCSYKSSRKYLRSLPTKAPNVILGPGEDAGIVEIAKVKGDRYGLVIGHESHNHPSQIVPFEGAATGIGGCVRDVICMGGKVIGVLDPLRFGDISSRQSRQIAQGVVAGIGGYGNPIGVPNVGGDAYFENYFDENCLVNVVTVGIVRESGIIHSYVPASAADEQWDIIIVGKPTDASGMGGAAFSSGGLDENEKEKNKGAVQEPNPFLKRHLMVSTYDLCQELRKKGLMNKVSFKDMGAGGITCSTVEQVAKTGLGARINLGKVNVALEDMQPSVIGCAETQERFTWMCHPSLTKKILQHYNGLWDVPSVADGAGAFVIGKVTKGNYVLEYRGEEYVDAPARTITEGLLYSRPYKAVKKSQTEPDIPSPKDYNKTLLSLLASENIANKKPIFEQYDKQVQGYVVIEAGEADASVMMPLMDENVPEAIKKTGVALKTDGNPRYGMIDPYHGAVNAVVESMRNVAAVGAYPQAITNCLNYGNPEKKEQMWELKEGIRGIKTACEGIKLRQYPRSPTPVISGNVSLYNEGKKGHIAPSAIICCVGRMEDATKAVTMKLKKAGSKLYLVGERKNELGGSEYYRLHGKLGANVPKVKLEEAKREIWAMGDAVSANVVLASHDISEGGLAVCVAEMACGGNGDGTLGVSIHLDSVPLADGKRKNTQIYRKISATTVKLFSETGGFVVEVSPKKEKEFIQVCKKQKITPYEIGSVTAGKNLIFTEGEKEKTVISLPLKKAAEAWMNGLRSKIS